MKRREQERAGHDVDKGVNAVFVCVLDELHEEVICGIADMGVHISCEKPMSTRLDSCMRMYRALKAPNGESQAKETIFGICHVLRYSPHNMLLRHLVLEKDVIGDVLSIEHRLCLRSHATISISSCGCSAHLARTRIMRHLTFLH